MSDELLTFCDECEALLSNKELFPMVDASVFSVGDFFGEILRSILTIGIFGDFFGYFYENNGEILSKPSGHT